MNIEPMRIRSYRSFKSPGVPLGVPAPAARDGHHNGTCPSLRAQATRARAVNRTSLRWRSN